MEFSQKDQLDATPILKCWVCGREFIPFADGEIAFAPECFYYRPDVPDEVLPLLELGKSQVGFPLCSNHVSTQKARIEAGEVDA